MKGRGRKDSDPQTTKDSTQLLFFFNRQSLLEMSAPYWCLVFKKTADIFKN